eukprot:TRINITY_DN107089_c0_g1_i1.p1 TRINITY_DN107089_c0_g1~~TRINITY_DN107089_c0_g1_i1.p1  ORF type:complete len:203 (-),score=24.58 TRINITY_DN107089_c0_g1_i1:104-685(-)
MWAAAKAVQSILSARLPSAIPAVRAPASFFRAAPASVECVRRAGLGSASAMGARHLLAQGPRPASAFLSTPNLQIRTYRVQAKIPWGRVKSKVLAQEGKQRTTKNRNHAEVLKRFRLTRFGWERRRARFHGWKKRRRSSASKENSRKIQFVHRTDMLKMIRTATYFKLRMRDFPKDPNPNIRPTRAIVGSHFG